MAGLSRASTARQGEMRARTPPYSDSGISSIATTLTAKHATATRKVYPTTSPNRSLAEIAEMISEG